MIGTPKVTVALTTRDSERTIRDCLASVLNQTMKDFEIIVVDSNSSDRTLEFASEMAHEVVSLKCSKLRGRYEAICRAKGDYVLLLDSDQVLTQSVLMAALQEKHEITAIAERSSGSGIVSFINNLDRDFCQQNWKDNLDPSISAVVPRFYKRDVIIEVFDKIDKQLMDSNFDFDDLLIYKLAFDISQDVSFIDEMICHIESESLFHYIMKWYRRGKVSALARNYTESFVKGRRPRKGRGWIKTIVPRALRGIPFWLGYNL